MGDRSVVGVRSRGHETLYLYCHWDGSEQESILAQALRVTEARWRDTEYATRILVSHFVSTQWDSELGYGLSVGKYPPPDYHYIYEVDWDEQKVYTMSLYDVELESRTFQEFIEQHTAKEMVTA